MEDILACFSFNCACAELAERRRAFDVDVNDLSVCLAACVSDAMSAYVSDPTTTDNLSRPNYMYM